MQIYPEIICQKTPSKAEHLIFKYLKSCNLRGYTAFHSLLLPRHPDKYIGETDFLILSEKGILIIEIKGGLINTDRGSWTVKTEKGITKKLPESPFSQAKGNMYAVLEDMKKSGLPFVYRKHLLGYGVIFPNCTFRCGGLEIERKIILDSSGLNGSEALRAFILQIEKYWKSKLGTGHENMTSAEIKRTSNWLRPKFHSVPSLRVEHLSLVHRLVTLVEEQMDFLETARNYKRIICSGGAGTGKTLVGLEFARQKRQEGYNAYFVVPNPILGKYIKSRGYSESWLLFYSQLSTLNARDADWLIIDESQDIMTFEGFSEIDRVLDKGIEEGKWLLLCDRQNQTNLDGKFDVEFSDYLTSLSEIEVILPRNIRNTIQIISNTQKLTGKNIGKKGTGNGQKVKYEIYHDIQDAAIRVKIVIDDLVSKDLESSEILIIGKQEVGNSELLNELTKLGIHIQEINVRNISLYPFNQVAYSTISNCKGLESYVVIVDLNDFGDDEFSSNQLYVAITRPVGVLYLLYPKRMKKQIGQIQMKHISEKIGN